MIFYTSCMISRLVFGKQRLGFAAATAILVSVPVLQTRCEAASFALRLAEDSCGNRWWPLVKHYMLSFLKNQIPIKSELRYFPCFSRDQTPSAVDKAAKSLCFAPSRNWIFNPSKTCLLSQPFGGLNEAKSCTPKRYLNWNWNWPLVPSIHGFFKFMN